MTGVDLKTYPFIAGTSSAVIAAAGTQSGAVTLYGLQLVALQMPASWNSADMTVLASVDDSTYGEMYSKSGVAYSITAGTGALNNFIYLSPADFAGVYYLKIRSGSPGSAVTQTAARTISLVVRPV